MKNEAGAQGADLLIIGGGPAGIQASRMVKSMRPEWRVAVIRPEDHSMVYCALPYAIEGLFPLEKTFKKDSLVTDCGAELIRGSVRAIEAADRRVLLEDGRSLGYRRLLIATGARPALPPVPGVQAENVFTVKTAGSVETIMKRIDAAHDVTHEPAVRQRAVVIGSGAIGIEQATAYVARGLDVHLVEQRDHVLPHLLDEDMAEAPLQVLRDLGITVHLGRALDALEGGDQVNRVALLDGTRIDLDPGRDFVVVAVGMVPELGFLEGVEIERARDGLVVDARMRTSLPDVWAAGDCVAGVSGIDGDPLGGKLATNAVPMAKVAARDMLGEDVSYPGFFNGAATMVGRLRVGGTGFTENFARSRGLDVRTSIAETSTRFPMMPNAGQVRVKLVFETVSDRLIGAQVIGSEAVAERIDLLTFAIQHGSKVRDLAALSYSAQPWQTFFPARNAIVDAAMAAMG